MMTSTKEVVIFVGRAKINEEDGESNSLHLETFCCVLMFLVDASGCLFFSLRDTLLLLWRSSGLVKRDSYYCTISQIRVATSTSMYCIPRASVYMP